MYRSLIPIVTVSLVACASSKDTQDMLKFQIATGKSAYDRGMFAEAMERFNQAIKLDKYNFEAHLGLGNAAREMGNAQYGDAHNALSSIDRSMTPDERKLKQQMIGNLTKKATENHNISRISFEWVIRQKPDKEFLREAYYGAGQLYWERAFSVLMFPYNPSAEDKQATQKRMEEREQAIHYFEEFFKLDPETDIFYPHEYLAIGYFSRGTPEDYRRAMEHWQKYLSFQQKALKNAEEGIKAPGNEPSRQGLQEAVKRCKQEIRDAEDGIAACKQSLGDTR